MIAWHQGEDCMLDLSCVQFPLVAEWQKTVDIRERAQCKGEQGQHD